VNKRKGRFKFRNEQHVPWVIVCWCVCLVNRRFLVRLSAVSSSRPVIEPGVGCGDRQAWPKATAKRRAAGFTVAAANATLKVASRSGGFREANVPRQP